jgi:hypothetical protein
VSPYGGVSPDPRTPTNISDMAARMDCASVMFVGVRGSGETPPYGDTITSIRDALAHPRAAESKYSVDGIVESKSRELIGVFCKVWGSAAGL